PSAVSLTEIGTQGEGEFSVRLPDTTAGSAFACPNMCHGVDFDLERGIRKCCNLYEGRGREVAREELAAGLPHPLSLADVGDEDRHFDDIGHASAGSLEEMADLTEDLLCLGIFVAHRAAWTGCPRGHAGDIGDAIRNQAIRPGASGRLGDLEVVART